jgi:cysteinyl-tRNA synthetase
MALRVYNTLSGSKEEFVPITPGKVGMYVCGVTVYDHCHIGHARANVVFDMIYRYLQAKGFEVTYVRNYTDIDDKIINRANAEGRDPNELAEEYINQWLDQTAALNVKPATVYPRATRELGNIHNMIQTLIDKGNAYPMDGDVYYRVRSFDDYGKLSHRSLEDMRAGERVAVDERKEDPMDFALWKGAKPGEPAWDSPWGGGRPGWHIECSAMIKGHLGDRIDIHGGGADLIFPHHENEIAQSEAALDVEPFARYWVHNGLLQMKDPKTGEIIKMSKSLGNLITIGDLLARRNGADILRFMVLSANYRTPLTYTEEIYDAAAKGLERLRTALRDGGGTEAASSPDAPLVAVAASAEEQFRAAMDDDFNTPNALAVLFDLARAINRSKDEGVGAGDIATAQAKLRELMMVLGLRPDAPSTGNNGQAATPFIELLLEVRRDLRAAKQWQLADKVRDSMTKLGVALEDNPQGTSWRWSEPT